MGHLAAGEHLAEAWKVSIGEGGGYRRKIMAQPVVQNDMVFAMDSDAVASAFSLTDGNRLWRIDTKRRRWTTAPMSAPASGWKGTLYAVNGLV